MNPGNKPKRLSRITTLAAAVVLAAGVAAAVAHVACAGSGIVIDQCQ